MPIWTKLGQLPKNLNRADKRKVIATDRGFVSRINYTDVHSKNRVKEEILVAIDGAANSTNFGAPSISDIWFANNSIANNTVATLFVSFDEPIAYANATVGTLKLAIANTSGGVSGLSAVSNTTIIGANNTLRFTFTPTAAGTYAVTGSQTMSNATATAITSLKSTNSGNEAITLTISANEAALASSLVVTA